MLENFLELLYFIISNFFSSFLGPLLHSFFYCDITTLFLTEHLKMPPQQTNKMEQNANESVVAISLGCFKLCFLVTLQVPSFHCCLLVANFSSEPQSSVPVCTKLWCPLWRGLTARWWRYNPTHVRRCFILQVFLLMPVSCWWTVNCPQVLPVSCERP